MLDLTNDERRVVIFILLIYLLGLGINFACKHFTAGKSLGRLNQSLGKININTADKKLLMSISGIGDRLSQRIIDFRELNKGFKSPEELKGIKGITEAKFDKIKDYIMAQ